MSKSHSRRVSTELQLDRLEQRHARLKAEVAELDKRVYLEPGDELRLQRLKKEKLRTKDQIQMLRSGTG